MSNAEVRVQSSREALAFLPREANHSSGLLFFCGGGVAAEAYTPLLYPLAEKGFPVFIVRLPYRLAPLESHKVAAVARARATIAHQQAISTWVLAGHSLGGALACRLLSDQPPSIKAMVLIGTSHPKTFDLSQCQIPIAKVYAAMDGIATIAMVNANKHLLPETTRWIEIEGANHSQFGHYGHQLRDGSATISREQQQELTRTVLVDALQGRIP